MVPRGHQHQLPRRLGTREIQTDTDTTTCSGASVLTTDDEDLITARLNRIKTLSAKNVPLPPRQLHNPEPLISIGYLPLPAQYSKVSQ